MKNLFKFIAATGILSFCHSHLYAQQNSAPGKIDSKKPIIIHGVATFDPIRNKWYSSLVLLRSIYDKSNGRVGKDTSAGTGFVLSDNGKLYIVTAKNIITATQYKNSRLPNDSISVSYLPYFHMSLKLDFKLSGLSGNGAKNPAVAFTNNEENIAIISLQKKEYKTEVADLLAHGCMPVAISELDTSDNHRAGERLGRYGRDIMRNNESMNWGICYIQDNDQALAFFTTKKVLLTQGISGSIAIANEKLIGLMADGTEISYTDYKDLKTIPAKFTKAAYIISCLRRLQQMENDPAFNK